MDISIDKKLQIGDIVKNTENDIDNIYLYGILYVICNLEVNNNMYYMLDVIYPNGYSKVYNSITTHIIIEKPNIENISHMNNIYKLYCDGIYPYNNIDIYKEYFSLITLN